ncbi:MAG: hypothetical protein WCG93_16725 [Paludibacter sp.]
MARQLGHVKYKGTIGEIRHFKIKGMTGNFAGLNGGATGEQIKSGASFVRTRENMNEFGGCATVGKAIRAGQSQLMKQMSDPQFTGRLTGVVKKINLEDQTEARGYRAILISTQSQYLVGMNFNRNNSFEGSFTGPLETVASVDRNGVTLTVDPFNAMTEVNAPAGATHFRFINSISTISDYAYNSVTKVYEPIEPSLNELSKVVYSDYIELVPGTTPAITVLSELNGSPELTADVSLISCIGIEFYQKAGSGYYAFSVGNSMKIKNIF